MKRLFTLCAMLLMMGSTFAQVLVNETFETGNTVDQTPVGWICNDGGWKAGITIPDDDVARGRKPHTGDWYMYASYNSDVWIYKEINVTAGNYYRVSFWYATWHVDHFDLEVKAGTSANPSAMTTSVVPQFVVANEEFEQASGVFEATSTGTCYVGFHSTATNSPWYLSIDDIVIEQTNVVYFQVDQLTADTSVYFGEPAYLRFLIRNTGQEADHIQLNSVGALPMEFYQNGSPISQVDLPYNETVGLVAKATLPMNLTNNQELHATFNVTSTISGQTEPVDFKITALEPFNAFPLTEGFDGSTFPPTGWQNVATNGSYLFERWTSNDWPSCTPHNESVAMARYYCYTNQVGNKASLISPKMQLNATNNTVRYWIYRNYNNNIMGPDRINVYYSPTTNTADGTLLGTVHRNTMLEPVVGETSDWYEYTYTFDSPEGYGFIIIEGESGYGWNLCIDDVYINTSNVDNNPPTVISLQGTQTWADTEMNLTLRIYDESGVANHLGATYTIEGQATDITFNRSAKANYDFVATLPAKPNHTMGSIVFHLEDELGNTADSAPYDLHWDWQAPILLEGFEGSSFPPAGWTIESLDMSWFGWYGFRAEYATNYFGDEYYVVPPQGERMAGVEWDESEEWGPQDESLVTPLMTINRPTALSFETFCQYGIPDYHDHYKVDVLNTNTGSWSTLWDAVDQPQWVNQFQDPVNIDLSAYQGQHIRLRFRAHNNGSDVLTYSWFIDNVKVVATDTLGGPTGVVETPLDQVHLYPNPAKGYFRIDAKSTIHTVEVTTVTGTLIERKKVEDDSVDWPLEGYSKGVYFVRLFADEGVVTKKIVIE